MTSCVVPFYYGLGSRYSYLAASQLERIESETACRFEWLPLQSGELIRRANHGLSPFADSAPSGQYAWAYRQQDAESWAKFYDVPYNEPHAFRTDPADLALACWVADGHGLLKEMSRLLFEAVFVERQVITRNLLSILAQKLGMDGDAFPTAIDEQDAAAKHEAALGRAIGDGAFGVPSFVVAGQVFWGNDRLPLVIHALKNGART